MLTEPKTEHSYRTIPIPSYLLSVLKQFRRGSNTFVASDGDGFIDPRTLRNRFQRILEECGLEHIKFHALRHSFATRCVEVGVDVKSLSEILGHADVGVTLRTYVHSSMEQKRTQLERLASVRGQNWGQECAESQADQGVARFAS